MTERSAADLSGMVVRSRIGPFEIRYPPVKKKMVAGHMVPTLRKFLMAKKRKISIEILTPLLGETGLVEHEDMGMGTLEGMTALDDGEIVVVRLFRLGKGDDDAEDSPDDESVAASDAGIEFMDSAGKTWTVQREFKTDDIEILKGSSKVVEIKVGAGNDTVIRDLKFHNTPDADQFEKGLAKVKQLETDRAKKQIESYKESTRKLVSTRGGDGFDDALAVGEHINRLVEIVSAIHLPASDIGGTSDPYCIARMKGKDIHRTKVIKKNLQPIWTLETGSLFLLKCTTEEFFASSSGITFTVKDYDMADSDDVLATVSVPLKDILEGTGERTEYVMTLDKSFAKKGVKAPSLFLRFKPASEGDIEFMEFAHDSSKKHGVYANETFLPFIPPEAHFLKRQEKKGANHEVLHRVKPGPDPQRPEEATKWLTEQKINDEALKPSTNWVEAGSGDVGKVYVEVIGCDDLPNMDVATLKLSDKTDAFCCIVFEDCIVNTEVIGNTLSPRWPCWSQRAFVFNVSSPSSSIFLGVYDHDPEMGAGQMLARAANSTVHDVVGRIVINLTNFRPSTEYNLDYNLYKGELAEHREKARGTISLRIRLEYNNVRDSIVKSLTIPEENIVAVARKIDYDVANYAADGAVDDSAFSIPTLTGYIDELLAYESVVDVITEALMTVWLWRGHQSVTLFGKHMKLPLHSLTAFIWGITVTWNYDRFPAFVLFSIGWILLACNEHVRQHPSRWNHCPSYPELLQRLLFGRISSEMIAKNTNLEEIERFESVLKEKTERRKKEKEEEAAQEAKLQEEIAAEQEKAEEAEGMSKKKHVKFDVLAAALKPHLYPLQKQLRVIIQYLRITKNVFRWGEAYYTFWIVTICFAAALIAFWVPWSFFIRWTLRIVVFVALGPWMWLVDKYVFKTDPNMTKEERDEAFRQKMQARYDEVVASASVFMIRKENAMKMKCMKQFFFGKYLLHVPQFREDLFDDIPLPSSHCAPFKKSGSVVPTQRKFGQKLEGAMIPKREVQITKKPAAENAGKKKGLRGMFDKATSTPRAAMEKVPLLGKKVFAKHD